MVSIADALLEFQIQSLLGELLDMPRIAPSHGDEGGIGALPCWAKDSEEFRHSALWHPSRQRQATTGAAYAPQLGPARA